MTLEQYAYIAEIIGVILIIASLVYVARQLRQNTDAQLATSRQATLESDLNMLSDLLQSPELYLRSLSGELTAVEEFQFEIILVRFLRIREFAWIQYRSGVLDEPTWQSYMRPAAGLFASELAKAWWKRGTYLGNPEFIEYVDRWFVESGIIPDSA